MRPKVSVCIPAYRQKEFLRRTLRSVADQSFDDFEVVVTDDSPDDSIESLINEEFRFGTFRYVRNDRTLGPPGNWNRAVDLAPGEYIKFLHHDDWFPHNGCLGEFVKMLDENPEADFAFSSTNVCAPDGQLKFVHSPTNRQIERIRRDVKFLYPENRIGSPSATIYRKRIGQAFDERLKWVVDLEFYIRILRANGRFAYSAEPLICTTDGAPHQVTNQCLGNRDTELFEWIYLYDKVNQGMTGRYKHWRFLWGLLKSHRVDSMDDLTDLFDGVPVPGAVESIVRFRRLLHRNRGNR